MYSSNVIGYKYSLSFAHIRISASHGLYLKNYRMLFAQRAG
jgi:hypothetical protein